MIIAKARGIFEREFFCCINCHTHFNKLNYL
ncbi:hypothetical protein BHY_0986 (plasmid) [Borrelia nietonii YOR]|uniref:Uncharacterized protein n=1 Tax=Borrelia nietonii YOR TaxID=1293576 RepID=W5SAF1_9SPIR|nr:hypothetical protein BHY_0986 [Borrelia nietonii YOR]